MIKELLNGSISQNEVLSYYNVNITYKELPKSVYGIVFNYKGINNIVVNRRISGYKKKKTILHELAHIELNQLCQCDRDMFEFYINKYEDEADRYINFIKESIL